MSTPAHGANMTVPLFPAPGGERPSISRPLVGRADLLLQIPYARSFASSPRTAVAAA